jgi:chromosome segregation ATPase
VEDAFEELKDQTAGAEALDPQAAKLAAEHAASTRAGVKGLSVDTIVAKGATLGLEIGRTLSGLTEQCVAKAQELKTLQDAVALEMAELERLYDLDVASASIQVLIQDHENQKAELEKDINQLRADWLIEQTTHNKQVAERNAELQAARRKEQSEYEYTKTQERARAEDQFAEKVRLQERDHADRKTQFEKDLAERKAQIAKEEAEIAALKARIAGIDEEIKAAVAKEVAIATNSVKRELEFKHTLEKKDHEQALNLEKQKNVSLTEANTKLAEQLLSVTKQLDAAREQVQNIAVKSLESASGAQALAKVTEIVRENGSGPTRGGKS